MNGSLRPVFGSHNNEREIAMTDEPIAHCYTVAEIEKLRDWTHVILSVYYWSSPWSSHRYNPSKEEIENHVRTYMLAGIRPEAVMEQALDNDQRMWAAKPTEAEYNARLGTQKQGDDLKISIEPGPSDGFWAKITTAAKRWKLP